MRRALRRAQAFARPDCVEYNMRAAGIVASVGIGVIVGIGVGVTLGIDETLDRNRDEERGGTSRPSPDCIEP